MGKLVIADVAEKPPQPFAPAAGVSARGTVGTRAVVAGPDSPLWLWQQELAPGASLAVDNSPMDQLFYVREGSATSEGGALPTESVLAITRGAKASITAGANGAKLLHFRGAEGEAPLPRPHVHHVGPSGMFQGRSKKIPGAIGTLWLDSTCPDCGMWLQCSRLPPNFKVAFHAHTEDEVIVVARGTLVLGRRPLREGTALAIPSDTRYSFGCGDEGMWFLNFRPSAPWYVGFKEGMIAEAPVNEREIWKSNYDPMPQPAPVVSWPLTV